MSGADLIAELVLALALLESRATARGLAEARRLRAAYGHLLEQKDGVDHG